MFGIPYVIAGKTYWLKTFLFGLIGRCLSRKISLYFPKHSVSSIILIETSYFVLFFHCYCLSQIFAVSHLFYFWSVDLYVVCCVKICHKFGFVLYVS